MIKIIGDVMLDSWIEGDCDRVSPEAPVIVLKEKTKDFNVGGAGNLALNLSNLGTDTWLYGAVGKDIAGHKIIEILLQNNILSRVCQDAEMTTTKTRMVGQNGQHLLRVDKELSYTKSTVEDELLKDLVDTDTVLISDYNKGVIQKDTVQKILTKCKNVYVDPKQGFSRYIGAFLVKPNMKEYEAWFGKFNIEIAQQKCVFNLWTWLIVTDGANGIHVVSKDSYTHIKGDAIEVSDVSGAGDSVLAIIAHYSQYKDIPSACELAYKGAQKIVQKRGVSVISKTDVEDTVVWTNGVFDILHKGHLELLKFAKQQGDILIVGINSDSSVKRLKGLNRPFNKQEDRKFLLESCQYVDDVIFFDEDTPLNLIKQISPDILVKGGDYKKEQVVGYDIVNTTIIFDYVNGYSSTKAIKYLSDR
jgi:D-beta-D-heptose 7-phosphate kinase/D-beta-D-heptose 1-phosphate adenosyltransferase